MKTLDLVLIVVAILTIIFTVTMIIIFCQYNMIPDTLVTCWFACIGGECGICGWIKTTKERNQDRKWQLEDEKRMEEKNQNGND